MTGLEELEPRSRPTPLKNELDAPNETKPLALVKEKPGSVRRRISPLDSSTMFCRIKRTDVMEPAMGVPKLMAENLSRVGDDESKGTTPKGQSRLLRSWYVYRGSFAVMTSELKVTTGPPTGEA
jgi:hypothetical protein